MRKLIVLISFVFSSLGLMAQGEEFSAAGIWQGSLRLQNVNLYFNFDYELGKTHPIITIHNASERIRLEEFTMSGDSMVFRFPVFQSKLVFKPEGEHLVGYYLNLSRPNSPQIAFKAIKNKERTPINTDLSEAKALEGKWKTIFSKGTSDSTLALGIFKPTNDGLEGTFLTPTGDYRYLEGDIKDGKLYLSAFDGSHLFAFEGLVKTDGQIDGKFYSGYTFSEPWIAYKDDNAALPDAESLTFLKPGFKEITFQAKTENNEAVEFKSNNWKGKVTVIQLMGSWCPNCMDETRHLVQLKSKEKFKDLQIIPVAFERPEDPQKVKEALLRMKKDLGVTYPMYWGGKANKKVASEVFPMLNEVISFPTTIVLNKKGQVVTIYTGFSGPGTGEYYDRFSNKFNDLLEKLLSER